MNMGAFQLTIVLLLAVLLQGGAVAVSFPPAGFLSSAASVDQSVSSPASVTSLHTSWDDGKQRKFISQTTCLSASNCSGISFWQKGDEICFAMGPVLVGTNHDGLYDWTVASGKTEYTNTSISFACDGDAKDTTFRGLDATIGVCTSSADSTSKAKFTFQSQEKSFETLLAISTLQDTDFVDLTGVRGSSFSSPPWPRRCGDTQLASPATLEGAFAQFSPAIRMILQF